MKSCVAHPLRDWWLLLKSLFRSSAKPRPTDKAPHRRPHRTTTFFELP
jgi:hypothetical protein